MEIKKVVAVRNTRLPKDKEEITPLRENVSKVARRRPIHRIGFECHPCLVEGEVKWVAMDLNAHVGGCGAVSGLWNAFEIRGIGVGVREDIKEILRRNVEYIWGKFGEPDAMCYKSPVWPLYFIGGRYVKSEVNLPLYLHHGNYVRTKGVMEVRAEVNEEGSVLKGFIKNIEETYVLRGRRVMTHTLARWEQDREELPSKENAVYALSLGALSTDIAWRIIQKIGKKGVKHIYDYGWKVHISKDGNMEIIKPSEFISSDQIVVKNHSTFNAGGGSVSVIPIPFPKSKEEVKELLERYSGEFKLTKLSNNYLVITPLLRFPKDKVLTLKEDVAHIPKGKYAYHIRPFYDFVSGEVKGIVMKLIEYNEEGINNSSKGVYSLHYISGRLYTIEPLSNITSGRLYVIEPFLSKITIPISVRLVEVPLSSLVGFKYQLEELSKKSEILCTAMQSALEHYLEIVNGDWYEFYQRIKRKLSQEELSRLAALGVTKKTAEKVFRQEENEGEK